MVRAQLEQRLERLGVSLPEGFLYHHDTLASAARALAQLAATVSGAAIEELPARATTGGSPAALDPAVAAELGTEAQWAFAEEDRLLPGAFQNLHAYRILGPADPAHVAVALDAVVQRHPGLRTVVTDTGVRIGAAVDPAVLAAVRAPGALEDLDAQLAAAAAEPIDLRRAPVRWRLLRSGAQSVLVTQISHIAYDGRTLRALFRSMNEALARRVGDADPAWTTVPPDPAFVQAEQAYLASAEHDEDVAFWQEEGGRLAADLAPDPSAPLALIRQEPIVSEKALREAAARQGCSPSSALLWAFCEAAARVLGLDAFPVGIPVDVRSLYRMAADVPCAVHFVPVRFEANTSPAALHGRALATAVHARMPNREVREACGLSHIQPALMFHSYIDVPMDTVASPLAPSPLRVERIDTSALPVVRPSLVQGFAHGARGAIVFDGRARIGGSELTQHMKDALRRL